MKYNFLLKTAATRIYTGVRWYSPSLRIRQKFFVDPDFSDAPLPRLLLSREASLFEKADKPILLSLPLRFYYAWIPVKKGFFLLGPTRIPDPVQSRFPVHIEESEIPSHLQGSVPEYPVSLLTEDMLFCYNMERSGEADEPFLEEQDILSSNFLPAEETETNSIAELYNTIFENVENRFVHNPYSHEKRQVASIRNGEVEELKEILDERFPGRYGKVGSSPLRQEINIGIVETTLASRAAIEGGVHPETAYYLSDITIQKLDQCRDSVSAMNISREMQLTYARLVQDVKAKNTASKESENLHVSHCKDYVYTHLHGRITVREIARAIGLEENYLSSLFKRCEGETLTSYIMRQKIKLAKNMLMYSAYSYIQIASYLGFASQSHFGQTFKKLTDMTPKAFREAYAREDFIRDAMFTGEDA